MMTEGAQKCATQIDTVGYNYLERLYKTNAWNHPWIKVMNSLEELWLNLRYGNLGHIRKSLSRRIRKWLGTDKHV